MNEGLDREGRVERLWVKRAKRGPMDAVREVPFIARRGLADNADAGGRRQVTIISRERWAELTAALGDVDPVLRRANVMVSGIELEKTRGRLLQIGGATVRINGETRPCRALDFAFAGLQRALDPRWGGWRLCASHRRRRSARRRCRALDRVT